MITQGKSMGADGSLMRPPANRFARKQHAGPKKIYLLAGKVWARYQNIGPQANELGSHEKVLARMQTYWHACK